MTTTQDLWPIFHDGIPQAVHEADGDVCTVVIDIPHVRKHQGHDVAQRYQVRCEGVIARSFSHWQPPADPRPMHQKGFDPRRDQKADQDWWSRGSFNEHDWFRFVESLSTQEGRFWLQEATLDEGAIQSLKLRGNIGNDWCELAIEARVIVFTETSGKLHTTPEFIALGEAYWDALDAKG